MYKYFIDPVEWGLKKVAEVVVHFPAILLVCSKKALKSDWLLYFNTASSLAGEKMQFRENNGAVCV